MVVFLDDEPFGEAVDANTERFASRRVIGCRRRVEARVADAGDVLDDAREARFADLFEDAGWRPCVKAADDGSVARQVEERPRPVGGE